jgi:CRP-like cAMP-binding protein
MNQDLSRRRLRLTGDLESRTLADGTRLLKQTRCAEYLALPPLLAALPERFSGTHTVEEILHTLLRQEKPPAIRDYYDFVLGATQRGFLEDPADGVSARPSLSGSRWRLGWGRFPVAAASLALVPLGAAAFWLSGPTLADTAEGWVLVVCLVILLLSLAHLLSGCVLSGFGRLVYRAEFRVNRGLPYFSIDARDSFMSGRCCQGTVALQALTVPFAAALCAQACGSAPLFFAAALVALVLGCPLGSTPAHDLLYALFRKQYQLPRCAPFVLQRKLLTQLLDWRGKGQEEEYLLGYSVAVLVWLGCLIQFAGGLIQRQSDTFVRELLFSPDLSVQVMALVALLLLAALLLVPLLYQVILGLRNLYALLAPRWFRAEAAAHRRGRVGERPSAADVQSFLRSTLLFKGLPDGVLQSLGSALTYLEVKPGTPLIREGDQGDTLFIVYRGAVRVLKENSVGRPEPVAVLGPGDVFGEIALLQETRRTASNQSVGEAALFALKKDDFERLVVATLGAATVKTIIQVAAFLKRNALFADWPDKALLELAQQFAAAPFRVGEVLVQEGKPNDFFHLLYEGQVEVRRQGRPCAVVGPGDFLGEISLLRGTVAVADVVALSDGLCLKLGKAPFLAFVSGNLVTGLVVEEALEARLGREAAKA